MQFTFDNVQGIYQLCFRKLTVESLLKVPAGIRICNSDEEYLVSSPLIPLFLSAGGTISQKMPFWENGYFCSHRKGGYILGEAFAWRGGDQRFFFNNFFFLVLKSSANYYLHYKTFFWHKVAPDVQLMNFFVCRKNLL